MSDAVTLNFDSFEKNKYLIQPHFISDDLVDQCSKEMDLFWKQGKFAEAHIGKQKQYSKDIRADQILWWDPLNLSATQKKIWKQVDSFKSELNKRYFLGLWDFEGHYAVYPEGAFYKRHRDTFQNDDARVVSFVLYLNSDWHLTDGGELVIYTTDRPVRVVPTGGTLVCFLSHELEHEVLPTRLSRKSFTGWFRKRAVIR